jgi:hypothetical protein
MTLSEITAWFTRAKGAPNDEQRRELAAAAASFAACDEAVYRLAFDASERHACEAYDALERALGLPRGAARAAYDGSQGHFTGNA